MAENTGSMSEIRRVEEALASQIKATNETMELSINELKSSIHELKDMIIGMALQQSPSMDGNLHQTVQERSIPVQASHVPAGPDRLDMDCYEKDERTILSDTHHQMVDKHEDFQSQGFSEWTRSASASGPVVLDNSVGHTGPLRSEGRDSFIQMSGSLSISHNPEDTDRANRDVSGHEGKPLSVFTAYAKGRMSSCLAEVKSPDDKFVQYWNKFFAISCLVSIFVDPFFFYALSGVKDNKCIFMDETPTIIVAVFRSITDIIYFLHMLLQFRLAYVALGSRTVDACSLDGLKKIAQNYPAGPGLLWIDTFAVLPLPQIIIFGILSGSLYTSGANDAKNFIRVTVLIQDILRLSSFLPLLLGEESAIGFVFESAWANFVINLLTFVLFGHVIGSWWYLLGLQKVNQCLQDACYQSKIKSCVKFIDCGLGHGHEKKFDSYPQWSNWRDNANAAACFNSSDDRFDYGIYQKAVNLVDSQRSFISSYVYSSFWGFQQISTLAGNQVPSYDVWEVMFTMAIIGLGLLLFALLIGKIENFLQSLGKRRFEMSLERLDAKQWMTYRDLGEDLWKKVREAQRYNWALTRGINEETLIGNLSEDLQRKIRRHLFSSLKGFQIFALMEEPVLDAIRERLKQKTYIEGSEILHCGEPIEKMVFIKGGKWESVGENGNIVPLSEEYVCGEELLSWYRDHSSRVPGHRPLSKRTVRCATNVEAFMLTASDLEQVMSLFPQSFKESPSLGR